MTSPTFIPPHLRESVFSTYAPYIATAVNVFPDPTSFLIPHGTAPSTFVARFRDAILSYRIYNWPSTSSIDRPKLLDMLTNKKHVIRLEADGLCWFRPRLPAGRPNQGVTLPADRAPASASLSLVPWRDATLEELAAAALLLHTKRLIGPILLEGDFTAIVARDYSTLDVSAFYDTERKLTILT